MHGYHGASVGSTIHCMYICRIIFNIFYSTVKMFSLKMKEDKITRTPEFTPVKAASRLDVGKFFVPPKHVSTDCVHVSYANKFKGRMLNGGLGLHKLCRGQGHGTICQTTSDAWKPDIFLKLRRKWEVKLNISQYRWDCLQDQP